MSTVIKPRFSQAVASAAYTTTASTAAFAMGIGDSYSLFGVHTAVSGTSPTFDWVISTSVDKGTTYVNLPLRFTQVTAATTCTIQFKLGIGGNEAGTEGPVAATGGTLVKNCVFDPDFMKLNVTVGGSTPTATVVWYLGVVPPAGRATL